MESSCATTVQLNEGGPGSSLCEFWSFRFSAGAGRTGTFIALSNILERVKAEGLLDVFQTVKSLRTQRPHMVQTVVGGKRDHVRSAVRKLVSARKQRLLPVTTLLLFPPLGAIRLLLQGGSGFRRHLLRLCQFQITSTTYTGTFLDNCPMNTVANVVFFKSVFCT